MSDTKHGWVTPRADGARARCGGPEVCGTCQTEQAQRTALSAAPRPLPLDEACGSAAVQLGEQEVRRRIAGLDESTQKKMVCALVGHSRIVTGCFGYVHCARCDAQIGDTLAGIFDATQAVIVGHACERCHANFAKLDWRDTLLAPDPFDLKEAGE